MNGLSTLATAISVLAFPLVFIVLLYPRLAGSKGKWYGACFYGGIAAVTMLIAVAISPVPHQADQAWDSVDWVVMFLGSGALLAFTMRKYSHLKKGAGNRKKMDGEKIRSFLYQGQPGGKKHKSS